MFGDVQNETGSFHDHPEYTLSHDHMILTVR